MVLVLILNVVIKKKKLEKVIDKIKVIVYIITMEGRKALKKQNIQGDYICTMKKKENKNLQV